MSALDMDLYGVYVSVDYYGLPDEKDKEFYLYFPEYTKFVSREFDSREEIMKDKNITDMVCLKCARRYAGFPMDRGSISVWHTALSMAM